jgi:hypothetical protein
MKLVEQLTLVTLQIAHRYELAEIRFNVTDRGTGSIEARPLSAKAPSATAPANQPV